jgi:hypothetical protein
MIWRWSTKSNNGKAEEESTNAINGMESRTTSFTRTNSPLPNVLTQQEQHKELKSKPSRKHSVGLSLMLMI